MTGGGIHRAVVRSPAVTATRHAQACPPPLGPRPGLDHDAVALLLLPPALSLVHPAVYLPASIFVLLTPARNSASLLAAPPLPLLPTAITTLMTSAALKPQGNHHRRTTSHGTHSPCLCRPCHPGRGGGGRAQNIAPCCSRDRTADQSGPPHGRFLVVVVIVVGFSAGGERGGSSGSDNDMACGRMLCFWFGGDVNYLGVNDVVWVGPVGMEKMTVLHYQ